MGWNYDMHGTINGKRMQLAVRAKRCRKANDGPKLAAITLLADGSWEGVPWCYCDPGVTVAVYKMMKRRPSHCHDSAISSCRACYETMS